MLYNESWFHNWLCDKLLDLEIGLVTGLVTGLRAGFAGLAIPEFLALEGWLVRVAGAVDQRVCITAMLVSIYKLLN